MLVTRPLELEALILLLLTTLRVGVPIMALYGKSRLLNYRKFMAGASLSVRTTTHVGASITPAADSQG